MEENMEREYTVVFMELLLALKEKIAVILAVTIVSGLLGWGVSSFLLTPRYEASVNMIVNAGTDAVTTLTNDNISTSQNLVDTYAIIIKSNTVLNQVISELNLDLTYEELYEQVSVNAINKTQVMKIAAQDEDPAQAQRIVDTIVKIAPDIVVDAVGAGSCKVVSQVAVDSEPVFPDVQNITVLAALAGMVICIAVIVLKELLNDFIVDDMDVQRKLGIPVLGIIPDVEGK